MHILITGAAGFIGQLLAETLLDSSDEHTLLLTDIIVTPVPSRVKHPQNVRTLQADLCASTSISSLLSSSTTPLDAVYILHGTMSSASEADFNLGQRVNIDSTRTLLEGLRTTHPGIRTIYASSQAVYGPPFPLDDTPIDESHRPTPASSYGAEKLIAETLLNDHHRRGHLDALILRFPTVVIRPGPPSPAASAFLSGIIREPLHNRPCVIPLRDRGFSSWICSPRTLAINLLHALTLPADKLASGHDRVVNMPGRSVTVQEMLDVLVKVRGDRTEEEILGLVSEESDEAQERILRSWATSFDNKRAIELGFSADPGYEQAAREYVEELGK